LKKLSLYFQISDLRESYKMYLDYNKLLIKLRSDKMHFFSRYILFLVPVCLLECKIHLGISKKILCKDLIYEGEEE